MKSWRPSLRRITAFDFSHAFQRTVIGAMGRPVASATVEGATTSGDTGEIQSSLTRRRGCFHIHTVGLCSLRINCNNSGTIPPTAVGGWLKSNLRRRRRLDFNHPPTAVGGIRGKEGRYVGWTLTIHRLPSVGFATIHCCIHFSKTINARLNSARRYATKKELCLN